VRRLWTRLRFFEERRRDGRQHDIERNRLGVIGIELEPDLLEGFDDLVVDRTYRDILGRIHQFAAAAHRPLLAAAGDPAEPVDDAAVVVLTDTEVDLQ
jgi:hypothetical protein